MLGWKKKRGKRRWVVGREAHCFPPMAVCTGEISRKGIKEREWSDSVITFKLIIF
jgi:hypothetical protein